MEGIAKTRVWDLPAVSEMRPKNPSKNHHIFDGFWEPVGTHLGIKNPSKMDPKSTRNFIDFLIDFYIKFGTILGG